MADIDVERKGPNLWPFVLGAVVLALLIWGLIRLFDREEDRRIDTPAVSTDTLPGAGPR